MVSNPMQRKSRNSLILGIIVGVFLMGLVVAFLYWQLDQAKKELEAAKKQKKKVYVLSQDVSSGDILTTDLFSLVEVDGDAIPLGATANIDAIRDYFLVDKDGNQIITNENGQKVLIRNGTEYKIETDKEKPDTYYITVDGQRENIKFETAPLIAKIDLNKNTVITANMFSASNEGQRDDLRRQEYNMLKLASTVQNGDYVDVRFRLPSGLDYIVISKKQVEIPEVGGIQSEGTIWINLTEEETLAMSAAIVESYMMEGSILYTTNYVEPGLQEVATPTYIPSEVITNMITQNPNVVTTAAEAVYKRYNADARNRIQSELNKVDPDDATGKVTKGTDDEVKNAQSVRKSYLESLAGAQ